MFNTNTLYQTRDGKPARFISAHEGYASFELQLTGVGVGKGRGWYRVLRNHDGTYYDTHRPSDRDIVPLTASDEEIQILNRMAKADLPTFILIIRELRNGD